MKRPMAASDEQYWATATLSFPCSFLVANALLHPVAAILSAVDVSDRSEGAVAGVVPFALLLMAAALLA